MRILVITGEPLPVKGIATTGAGLRAFGLADALLRSGFDVVAAMPANYAEGLSNTSANAFSSDLPVTTFNRADIAHFVKSQGCDLLLVQHWSLMEHIDRCDCPVVIDLAGPHLLERLYWGEKNYRNSVSEKIVSLRKADFLICSGYYQRHYFLPFLQLAGWDVCSENPLPVVHFSLPPIMPQVADKPKEPHFVYGGFFLPWQDPSKPLSKLVEILEKHDYGYLDFYGGPHPLCDVSRGSFLDLSEKLENSSRVVMHPITSFDQLIDQYSKASVAIDLMRKNPERELAFTTRTIVYLWCGLPVLHNNYSEISPYISDYDAGWICDYEDEKSYETILESCSQNGDMITSKSHNAQKLALERFSYEKTIGPLYEFCKEPYVRKEKQKCAVSLVDGFEEVKELREKCGELESELLTLKGKIWFRLFERSTTFYKILAPFVFVVVVPISVALLGVFVVSDFFGNLVRGKSN